MVLATNENGLSISTNKTKFTVSIELGQGETYYSVGYSSPNFADVTTLNYDKTSDLQIFCKRLLNNYRHEHSIGDYSKLLMNLLNIAK